MVRYGTSVTGVGTEQAQTHKHKLKTGVKTRQANKKGNLTRLGRGKGSESRKTGKGSDTQEPRTLECLARHIRQSGREQAEVGRYKYYWGNRK